MAVQVTVFDLMTMAGRWGRSVTGLVSDHLTLALAETQLGYPYRAVMLSMKKPCPFLGEDSLCSIQHKKPLACRLFPEAFIVEGRVGELRRHPEFRWFPCFLRPMNLGPGGKTTTRIFRDLWSRERKVSNQFFFGEPLVVVDVRKTPKRDLGPGAALTNQALMSRVMARASALEEREVKARLLASVSDAGYVAGLKRRITPPRKVFSLGRGGLRPKKKRPLPLAHYSFL